MKFNKRSSFAIVTILLLFQFIYGQEKPSALIIIVTNQLNQRIPDAQLILFDSEKRQREITTDKKGIGRISNLPKGEFSIIIKAEGFKEYNNDSILIRENETKTLELTLELKPIESTLNVDPSEGIDKDNYGIKNVLTEEDIKKLPDDPEQFERAIRQILGQSITGEDLSITVNGIPMGNLPPKEAIQQIRVDQNIFSSKNSGVAGGGIQVITKAGMTKFSGSIVFGFEDSRLNASNPFLGKKVPFQNKFYRLNLTGPLTKNSSFILMLNRYQRDGNSAINATILNNNLQIESYKQSFLTPKLDHSMDLYINYDPKDKHKLFFNYKFQINQGKSGVGGFSLPESLVQNKGQSHSFSISHQYLPKAELTSKTIFTVDYAKDSNITAGSSPALIVLDAFSSGNSSKNGSNNTYKIRFSNDTEKQVRRNDLQYGFEINAEKRTIISQDNFNGTYLFTGKIAPLLDANNNPMQDGTGNPLTGQISSIESYRRNLVFRRLGYSPSQIRALGGSPDQFTISVGNPKLSVSQINYAFYFQNDYKVNETLGIGSGVRYENQTNIKSNFNLSPRISLNWQPKVNEKKKMIFSLPKISTGGGVYYSKFGISNIIIQRQLNTSDRFSYFVSNSAILDVFPNTPAINLLENSSSSKNRTFIDPNLKNPLQATYNVSIVKNLTKKISLNFSYTHSNDFRSLLTRNINAPLAGTYSIANPNSAIYPSGSSGYIFETLSIGKSVSDRFSLNPRLPRYKILRYDGFVNIGYSFTKSKSNSVNGSSSPFNPYDFKNEYSPSPSDGIQSLNLLFFQSLPFDSRISLSWILRSGSRFNIITGRDTNGDGYYLERPSFASDPNKPGVIATPYGLLDPNPSIGDKIIPRNFARGPSVQETSLNFNKSFDFNKDPKTKKGKQSFNLNVSVFNPFNITSKGIPIGNMASPNFAKYLNNSSEGSGGFSSVPRSFSFNMVFSF